MYWKELNFIIIIIIIVLGIGIFGIPNTNRVACQIGKAL